MTVTGVSTLLRIVVSAMLLLFTSPAWAGSKLALVIGNADYANMPKLLNPANDAKLIAGNLELLGFKVTLATDRTQAQMKSAIARFSNETENAGADVIVMFYYAGHGVQIDGTNYLVPVDAGASSATDVVIGAVSATDLLKALELARAKVNVVVLDACRDNPFKATTRGLSRGLARVDAPAGSIVAYSTAPGQVAQDGSTANSPYAEALAKHMATPGLSLEEVFRNVRIDVSVSTSGAQVPWEETSLTQVVVLAEKAAGTTAVVATVVVPTTDPAVEANRAFLLAVATNTIESYDDFMRKHPGAKEVPQAMHNLTMLSDEKHWREATAQNTLGAYKIYLNLHGNGSYAAEAQQMILGLSSKQPQQIPVTQKTPVSELNRMTQATGYDVSGTDIRTLKNVDFDTCTSSCSATENCVAAAYRRDLRRCYMKSTANLIIQNGKVELTIRANVQGSVPVSAFEMLPQTDMPGNDMQGISVTLNFAQDCLRLCESTNGCNAFSYVTANKACWLKASAGALVANPPVVSGQRVR